MTKWIIICTLLCFGIGKADAQQNAAYPSVFNTDRLMAGETAVISYNPSQTALAGAKDVKGIMYLWNDYIWNADEVDLIWRDSCWTAEYRVPEGAALVCPVFRSSDTIDKGGRFTYGMMTINPVTNAMYPCAYVGWGILRNPLLSETYGLPGFCDTINAIGDDVMFYWLKQQLQYFPGERANVLKYAIPLLKALGQDSKAVEQALRGEVAFILSDTASTEQQLLDALRLVKNELRDDSLCRALETKTLEKFPRGLLARDRETRRIGINSAMDQDARMDAIAEMLHKFPPDRFRNRTSDGDKMYYDLLRGYIYLPVVRSRDYSNLYKYMKDSPSWLLTTYFWHLVQLPWQNGEATGAKLLPMAMDLINELLTRPCEGADRVTPHSEYVARLLRSNAGQFFAYAGILAECGRKEEALQWVEKLKPSYGFKDASFNDFYVTMLSDAGRTAEVIPFIESSIGENAATQAMLDILKEDYLARHKSAKGFETYVDGLKSAEQLQALQAKVREMMVKEKVAGFTLTDLKGKEIRSDRLKGKILILDFWATWCAPCKAALPAMQMAVNKFRKDKGVAFYFVTTQEKPVGLTEKVSKYIDEKGYGDMNFVFDTKGEGKTNDKVYSAFARQFQFSGIPLKVVIDGDGCVRWFSVGYMGSPTELVDEIGFVIDEIKNEKK